MSALPGRTDSEPARVALPASLLGALAATRPGHALPRAFYDDAAIFEQDLERMLLRHWFCAGHESSLPRPGDFFLVELAAESVIIARDRGGGIRALLNVCRHRGSRVCVERSGSAAAGRFTCPYHGWSYGLDGQLLAASEMPQGFRREETGLRALRVEVREGLIFVSFAAEPPAFDEAARALAAAAGAHGWARARIAHRATFEIRANWKLAIENYLEFYHCQPAHPAFARGHLLARPWSKTAELERAARERAQALGTRIPNLDGFGLSARSGQESAAVFRSALCEGHSTGSRDGAPVAPLMGDFRVFDGSSTYFDVGPISHFLAYPDHGIVYRFIPRSVDRTGMEVLWLVDAACVEGRDYELERLTWLWQVTSVEDKTIIERNQEGVNSRFYEPGPYSLQEDYTRRFTEWYLAELSAGQRQSSRPPAAS